MARNGNGIYVLPSGQPVVPGTTISSTTFNALTADLANTLTLSLATDGQTAMSANLTMAGNKLTGLGAATVAGDSARFEQIGTLALAQGAAASGPLAASGITGAAASGSNSDITALTGLTTTLSILQGGTGATTVAAVRTAFNVAAIGVNTIQIGSSSTDSQNFAIKTNVDGTGKLARGAAGGLGDIVSWDAAGKVAFSVIPSGPAQSMIKLNAANGYGSTNTCIRRFVNVLSTQGSDITYADSATLGASFTVNVSGVYAVSYSDQFSSGSWSGLSLNTTRGSTAIQTINAPEMICVGYQTASDGTTTLSATQYYAAGSVIRPHTQGTATGGTPIACQFTITRVS